MGKHAHERVNATGDLNGGLWVSLVSDRGPVASAYLVLTSTRVRPARVNQTFMSLAEGQSSLVDEDVGGGGEVVASDIGRDELMRPVASPFTLCCGPSIGRQTRHSRNLLVDKLPIIVTDSSSS